MFDILYTGTITFIIMLLLHHLYNYLQTNLTIPKVNEIVQTSVLHDLQEVQKKEKEKSQDKDELKAYLNQFKKK
jgi:hypothetical protein